MKLAPRKAVRWIRILVGSLGRSRTFGLAGEMTFWVFLSLLPIAAVAGLVLAKLAFHDSKGANAMGDFLGTLPPAARQLVTDELARVSAWNGGAVAPAAAATFVWLASSGIQAVFDGLELETEAEARPWWRKRLLAIATCVAMSIGVALIALLSIGLSVAHKFASGALAMLPLGSTLAVVLRLAVSAAIAVALVSGLYAVGLPSRARKRMPILPGAIAAVVLQFVLGLGYGAYVSRVGDSGAYQAGLAVIGVTLMALYLLCVALLVGVEINQMLGVRRLLRASMHPELAKVPVTKKMVCCDDKIVEGSAVRTLRPSFAGGS